MDYGDIIVDYGDIIVDYEKKGIIERVPDNEIAKETDTVYYLPHHPVIRKCKETTKVRPVFDGSCSKNKPSLNDCLYAGPNLLPKIFDILIQFRFNYVAILADIQEAFRNVEIAEEHKDYVRFLWINSVEECESKNHKFPISQGSFRYHQ